MKQGTALQTTTRWLCFIASILTFALGIVHIVDTKPRIHWPPRGFADDNNAASWRYTLFTFMPSTFVDLWTPFVLGLAGIFAHFANVSKIVAFLTHDFLTAALFQAVCGLFATLAYNGGLGIIFSVFCFLASLMCFIVAFSQQESASLEIKVATRRR
eukprot:Protomagalhaensia_sp_Gyna_25__5129@NODE_597_length_3042_cov_316_815185_g463_i0_p2_GENE_NODE_597_length_3042_cov_316_815185_g463_i0NODE_597_length_3042_cov_316_815185_g463_i0_p2_ORF_typecomplete_len157_score22_34BaxI_1/PF12811_7/61BaxI_1/PF12811_7/0_32COPI_assoc/PF08507_10/4_5MscS_TM/PF12794_7/3_4e02MscS_TM/PF12794_7/0_11DUF2367/PF10164_9/13DUF2367/PF10164_9/62DUF4064/PF13273_6/8_4DUF4064/PF13273_6/1e03DUF4064/PF13273_6/41DUF2627/PF11118_8/24DUF2627/PF11118_8/12DUF2627/PF11118_8/6e02_NODE_597_len